MKKQMKKLVVAVLGRQVRKLRKKHQFRIIGVVGGIGKTSTKMAIAQTLGKHLRVRYQEGNYNDIVSVPLIFFGHEMPSLTNPLAWIKIFLDNSKQIGGKYPYDVVVVELGTDGPGQIAAFKQYLDLDIAVVTAIVPEHMEYFADLSAVAAEELSVSTYSKQIIYNADLVPDQFWQQMPPASISYGINKTETSDYYLANIFHSAGGLEGDIKHQGDIFLHLAHEVVSETQLYSVLAAVIVSNACGLQKAQIIEGVATILPVSGRLRRLKGINNSVIIDDTYNSSPEAVKAALQTIYKLEAPQKIAILGSMNELGQISAAEHKAIGEMCDPKQLDLIVTIGNDANTFLAPAATALGCNVKTFDSPYDAGEFVQSKVEPGAIVLAKGSQNRVFSEEAVKQLLADPEDASKLVRQSDYWMKIKANQFGRK